MPLVVITGSEVNEPVKIDSKYLELSDALKRTFELFNSGADEVALSLPNVPTKSLKLVVEFLKHYTDDATMIPRDELKSKLMKNEFDEWDEKFLAVMDRDQLVELACVANFMTLDHLQLICAKKMATFIKDASTADIRSVFKLTDEWKQDEFEEAKKEMDWLFGKKE